MKQKVTQHRGGSTSLANKESATAPDWQPIASAPENLVLMTKIDDGAGVRNVQAMLRSGHLWFFPDRSMRTYYTPTHWRGLTANEWDAQRKPLEAAVDVAQAQLDEFDTALAKARGTSPEPLSTEAGRQIVQNKEEDRR